MRKILALLIILGLLFSVFPNAVLLAAPGDIAVSSSSHENKFPNELIFRVQVRSSAEIKKITLYYTAGDAKALSYAYPTITPGTSVSAEYTLNTQKTYIPPSTEIRYQWQIDDAAGNSLKTEFTTFNFDDVRFKWNKIDKDGVAVYWYKGTQTFASDLLEAGSTAIKRLSSELGVSYERPVRILVYDSKADMDPAIPKRSDTYSRETITLGVRLSADVLLLLGSQADAKETLAHELSHMVVHQMVENPYSDIPSWLDEGLAMLAEGELPAGFKRALEDGVRRDGLLSLRSMTSYSGDPGKVNLFYGESYSVVKYLVDTYGRDKMTQLLNVFKEGTATDDALRTVYGFTQDELDAKWRTSLGLAPRSANNSVTGPDATPVATLVPFGVQGSAEFDNAVLLACVALVLCTVVLLLAVIIVLIVLRRRR